MGVCRFFAVCEALDLDPVVVMRGEHWYPGQRSGYDHINDEVPLRTKHRKARNRSSRKRAPKDAPPIDAPKKAESVPPPASVRRPSRPSHG
jgi:hypothetical protein